MIDATLQVIDAQVNAPDPGTDTGPEGGILQVVLVVGLALPVSPTQVAHIPAAILRANFNKDGALSLASELTSKGENLKSPSNIQVATDLAGVERAAKQVQNLTGNGS